MNQKNNFIPLVQKYRARILSEIVGQEFARSFLQNSLFKDHLYPLYLFSGCHGSGKTSSARIFSLARLCKAYETFRNDTHQKIPCYACHSCDAFTHQKHPDIIELDAASNSGIDAIRSMLSTVPLLPLMGEKKFYIIDEAHMLTKASANACLKMMEEPPAHVHFILATTEPQKIIDTIRSRSIHIPFFPIDTSSIAAHLTAIAEQEKIPLDDSAALLIAHYAQGSARDALQSLEKLHMIGNGTPITTTLVEKIEQTLPELRLEQFISRIIEGNSERYLAEKTQLLEHPLCIKMFWQSLLSLLQKKVKEIIRTNDCSQEAKKIIALSSFCYETTSLFFTISTPFSLFDIFFYEQILLKKNEGKEPEVIPVATMQEEAIIDTTKSEGKDFIAALEKKDPLLSSVCKKGIMTFLHDTKELHFTFHSSFTFYQNFITTKETLLSALLADCQLEGYRIKTFFNDSVPLGNVPLGGVPLGKIPSPSKEIPPVGEGKPTFQGTIKKKEPFFQKKYDKEKKTMPMSSMVSPEIKAFINTFPGETFYEKEKE